MTGDKTVQASLFSIMNTYHKIHNDKLVRTKWKQTGNNHYASGQDILKLKGQYV